MSKMSFFRAVGAVLLLVLVGCHHGKTSSEEGANHIHQQLDQMQDSNRALAHKVHTLPPELDTALGSDKTVEPEATPSKDPELYDIAVQALPAKVFFRTLAAKTNANMVVDEDVVGVVSLDLKQVSFDEILEVLSQVYDYYFEKTGKITHVTTMQLRTKVFTLEGLALKRSGISTLKVENSTQGTTISGSSSEVKTRFDIDNLWEEIKVTLESIVEVDHRSDTFPKKLNYPDKPSVSVNQSTGTLVVRAYPKEMQRVEGFVRRLRNMYSKQVVIETKLLEVQLRKSHESGLDLQLPHLQFTGDMNGVKYFKDEVTYSDASGVDQPFTVFLKYLSLQGQVSVLSSPRITTMNKQKAVIKIGRDNYYLVGTETQSSTQNDAVSTSLSLQPFFSGIALDVTPEIQEDNKINLHIHPLISEVVGKDYSFQLGGETSESYMLNLPESTVRESDSVIQAYSGQFIAIGGLMKRKTESAKKSLPKVFGKKTGDSQYRDISDTTELVIVLWPKIVDLEDSGLSSSVDMQGQDTYTYDGPPQQGVGK